MNPTSAAKKHAEATAKVEEWNATLAQLQADLAEAETTKPLTPGDLEGIANRQTSLTRQVALARQAIQEREVDVLNAARVMVAAEADALQPAIDSEAKIVEQFDAQVAKLRVALEDYSGSMWQPVQTTRESSEAGKRRWAAAAKAKELTHLQDGLRAALNGENVRPFFRTVRDLPASLHPETGVLPQRNFQGDLDNEREEAARLERVAEAQAALDGLARHLGVGELTAAEWDEHRAAPQWAQETIAGAAIFDSIHPSRIKWAAVVEQAAAIAEAASFATVAKALDQARNAAEEEDQRKAKRASMSTLEKMAGAADAMISRIAG